MTWLFYWLLVRFAFLVGRDNRCGWCVPFGLVGGWLVPVSFWLIGGVLVVPISYTVVMYDRVPALWYRNTIGFVSKDFFFLK